MFFGANHQTLYKTVKKEFLELVSKEFDFIIWLKTY
jgi:hypothetical protein